MPSRTTFGASLPPGAAHIAASLRYQERNIAAGKCAVCPKPQDRNSVRYCTFHLEQARERMRLKNGRKPKAVEEEERRKKLLSAPLPASSKRRSPKVLKALDEKAARLRGPGPRKGRIKRDA